MKRSAFTLIELLAVIALMAILIVVTTPAVVSMTRGNSLSRAGQLVSDQLTLARQIATAKNRDVEVRFLEIPEAGAPLRFRAIQLWIVDESGTPKPASRAITVPSGVAFAAGHSPLAEGGGSLSGNLPDGGTHGSCRYSGFRFRPSGTTDVPATSKDNYITLANESSANTIPENFYIIQVNPLTGRTSSIRP